MLKRVLPTELTIGMYVQKLEGSWLNHPFWRAQFLISDAETLRDLRNSLVPGVIIDMTKGRDVAAPVDSAAPQPEMAETVEQQAAFRGVSPAPNSQPSAETPAPSPLARGLRNARRPINGVTPCRAAQEFGRAAPIAERSIKTVSKAFYAMRLGKSVDPNLVAPVIDDVMGSIQRNAHAMNGLLRCQRSSEHYGHSLATSALMITLGRQMQLPLEALRHAGLAGLMLDSGIAVLPIDLASYGGKLANVPANIMDEHPRLGHEFMLTSQFGDDVALAALHHHERYDGKGFPQGLAGTAISLLGRMGAICDAYDELANNTEGTGLDPARALAFMQRSEGEFDPDLLAAFVAAMGKYPIGSLVELRSGRLAMVVDQGDGENAPPRCRVFYSLQLNQHVMQDEIELASSDDAIVGLADVAQLGKLDLAVLRGKLLMASAVPGS
jgi:hypothetical protein